MTEAPHGWLQPDWPAPANVRAIVTTREGPAWSQTSPYGFNVGSRCGDVPATVARNRACIRDVLALPSEPCWLHQVHGTHIALAPFVGEPEADAAISRTVGTTLAIQTADCLPVLFCDDAGTEIAAAHAGWRGLAAGVLEATLAAMHAPRGTIIAWLGPAIAAQSYEVGNEVRAAFIAHDAAASHAFTPTRTDHWLCDLYALTRQRLAAAGVTRICGGELDTFRDPRLHSYRRDRARSGRMASLVTLTSPPT